MLRNNIFYKFLAILLFFVSDQNFLFSVTNLPSTSSGLTMDQASKMSLDELLSGMNSREIMDVTGNPYLAAKFGGQLTPPPSPPSGQVAQDLDPEWKDLLRRQKQQTVLNQASQLNGGDSAGPVFDPKTSYPGRSVSLVELKSQKLQGFRDLILKQNPQISAVDLEMRAQTQFKNYLIEEERLKTTELYKFILGEKDTDVARTAIQSLRGYDLVTIKGVSDRMNQDRMDQYSESQVEKPAFVPMRSLAGPSESSGIPVTILLEIAKLPPESIDRLVNPAAAENEAARQTMVEVRNFELEQSKRETEKAQRPAIQAKQQKQQAAEDLKRQLESQDFEAQRKASLARQKQARSDNEYNQFLRQQRIQDLEGQEADFKTSFSTSEAQRKLLKQTTPEQEAAHKANKQELKRLKKEEVSEFISRMPAKPVDDIGLGGSTSPKKSLTEQPVRQNRRATR